MKNKTKHLSIFETLKNLPTQVTLFLELKNSAVFNMYYVVHM